MPVFENRFTMTKALFYEGTLRNLRDTYGKSALKAMLLFLAVWAALLIFTLSGGGTFSQTLLPLFTIGVIGLWLLVLNPRSRARQAWKTVQARYGDSQDRVTLFYRDHLELAGSGLQKSIHYTQVREIKFSRHLMILLCHDNTGVLLALDGFGGADPGEIAALIDSVRK